MPTSFLLAPVRGFSPDAHKTTVARLEEEGYTVYWPARDTDQADATGFMICLANYKAMKAADVVHVIWDGASQGCLFDLGMAFAMNKRIIVIDLPAPSQGKSFQNMVRAWEAAWNETYNVR